MVEFEILRERSFNVSDITRLPLLTEKSKVRHWIKKSQVFQNIVFAIIYKKKKSKIEYEVYHNIFV